MEKSFQTLYGLAGESIYAKAPICTDGELLTIPQVIAVSLYDIKPILTADHRVHVRVQESVDTLDRIIRSGRTVHGVNTGFGGSADTRTSSVEGLQAALKQHLHVGILTTADRGGHHLPSGVKGVADTRFLKSHSLPAPVVRAMMLIRCNSLLRGHSAVRIDLVRSTLALLEKGITPVVPLRGSISASGDLCPLSYIAGALEGNSDVYVHIDSGKDPAYLPANKALEVAGIPSISFQAKEGLGITNGTAASCAVACIAIHDASQLLLLTHLLTATCTEALLGRAQNYHPLISSVRLHPGQTDSAHTILSFLSSSTISPSGTLPEKTTGLAQDRYSLRTAPQWLGPYLEDLTLSHRQITTELNSTTDNPLVHRETAQIFQGGNFQATSLTSAAEKILLTLQSAGRLIYAQSSELLNYALTTGGLPPNLSADDPRLSFTSKGLDVNMAAYMAELSYLAHPVSSHVHNAEMDNQMVNSLALVAGRYTLEASEVLALMAATHIYTLCQALDLRCLHIEFERVASVQIKTIMREIFGLASGHGHEDLYDELWEAVWEKWTGSAHLDLNERGSRAVVESTGTLVQISARLGASVCSDLATLNRFQATASAALVTTYDAVRAKFFRIPTTERYISRASGMLYSFVRTELRIPMHRGLGDHLLEGRAVQVRRRLSDHTLMTSTWLSGVVNYMTEL